MSASFFRGRVKRVEYSGHPDPGAIQFEVEAVNVANRTATIINFDLQIWHSLERGSRCYFVGRVDLDQRQELEINFRPSERRTFIFRWHCTQAQLQQLEDIRGAEAPWLQLRASLLVSAAWNGDASPRPVEWEHLYEEDSSSWPIQNFLSTDQWIGLLRASGARNSLAPAILAQPLPPSFRRPAELLESAWQSHYKGSYEEALMASRKALECLGFNLFGDIDMSWTALLSRLLTGSAESTRTAIDGIIKALSKLQHEARHEKGAPVAIDKYESELGLVITAVLLKYLASKFKP
ncbi:MAG TPA: hypothetical protein VEB03_01430 [Candidatus Nanoarchaeia archaeon]|nr:hypothetical protein [Candidatus Nanoarchaeia archaeon]